MTSCNHDYVRKVSFNFQGTANNSLVFVVEAGSSTEMIANSLLKSKTIPLEGLGKLFTDEANCERWLCILSKRTTSQLHL